MIVLLPLSSLSYISWHFLWFCLVWHCLPWQHQHRCHWENWLSLWIIGVIMYHPCLWIPQILAHSEYQWYGRQYWQQWTWQKWKWKHRWYRSEIVVYSIFVTTYKSMFISHHILLSRIYIYVCNHLTMVMLECHN